MSESHSVANTNAQNATRQGLLSLIITIGQHHIDHSANGFCGNCDARGNHCDSGIGHSHHGTGLKQCGHAGCSDQFANKTKHGQSGWF